MTGSAPRPTPGAAARATQRAAELAERFSRIADTRMAGLPICHPRLQVAAVGFEPLAGSDGATGVLITPWFMNLIWFALDAADAGSAASVVGSSRERRLGAVSLPFIAAHEQGFGAYEACSLFSPMHDFVDQAAALATAEAVLVELRPAAAALPARRRFLLGAARADARTGA